MALFLWSDPNADATARPAFASRVACGAALRGGSAALPPHGLAHSPLHQRQRELLHRLATLDDNVQGVPITLPMLVATMVTLPMPVAVTPMPTTVQNMMLMAVPKMDTRAVSHTMRLGASLRDRATLPSPLRGLDPSGGYPSRLRSLRSLRAPLARRLARAHRRVPDRRRRRDVQRQRQDHRRVLLAPALRAVLAALVRALLRSAPALRFAPRHAPVPAPVRSPPPSPPAACCARLPAAPAATTRHSIAVAAPLRWLRRRRFPER